MKKLVVAMMCLMMCFSTVVPVQVHACSDLVASMCPSNPSFYPTYGGWEPAHWTPYKFQKSHKDIRSRNSLEDYSHRIPLQDKQKRF